MNTKQYLEQIERLDRMIQNKLSEINQLQCMATSITVPPKDVNVQTSGDKDRMGSTVAKLVDLERELDLLVDSMIEKKKVIIGQIESLENTDEYHILTEKYVNRKDWNVISVEMGYSYRNVITIHNKAMENFENMFGNTYMQ